MHINRKTFLSSVQALCNYSRTYTTRRFKTSISVHTYVSNCNLNRFYSIDSRQHLKLFNDQNNELQNKEFSPVFDQIVKSVNRNNVREIERISIPNNSISRCDELKMLLENILSKLDPDLVESWYPTPEETYHLVKLLRFENESIFKETLATFRKRARRRMGTFSEKKKLLIQSYLEEKKIDLTNIDVGTIAHLSTTLELSRDQVRHYIDRLHDGEPGKITDDAIEYINKYLFQKMENHGESEEPFKLSQNDLDHLRENLQLNYKQIKSIVRRFLTTDTKHIVTLESRQFIQDWYDLHLRLPKPEEYRELQNLSKLSKQQIYSILYKYKNKGGTISNTCQKDQNCQRKD